MQYCQSRKLALPVAKAGGHLTLLARFNPGGPGDPPRLLGRGSTYLYSLKPGATVRFSGPFGEFALKPGAREKVFIGGGAGMAPLRAMIHARLDQGGSERLHYWYGARNVREAPYIDEMAQLAKRHANFSWHLVLSEAAESGAELLQGWVHEAIDEHLLRDHPDLATCEFYLCGPPPMLAATRQLLHTLGVDEDNIALFTCHRKPSRQDYSRSQMTSRLISAGLNPSGKFLGYGVGQPVGVPELAQGLFGSPAQFLLTAFRWSSLILKLQYNISILWLSSLFAPPSTASGRTIKTTANHPYLVNLRQTQEDTAGTGPGGLGWDGARGTQLGQSQEDITGKRRTAPANRLSRTRPSRLAIQQPFQPSSNELSGDYTQWTKISELKEGMEIAAAKGECGLSFQSESGAALFTDAYFATGNNGKPLLENFGPILVKEGKDGWGRFLNRFWSDFYQDYPRIRANWEEKDVTEVIVKSKKDQSFLDAKADNISVIEARQATLQDGIYFIPSRAQGLYRSNKEAFIGEEFHLGSFLQKDIFIFDNPYGIVDSCLDIFVGQLGITIGDDAFSSIAGLDKLQDHIYWDARSFNAGFAKADFRIDRDSFAKIICHFLYLPKILYHMLLRASSLTATHAYAQESPQSPILWDKIVSIEPLPAERVYDIEVEGTHNFIGNGIFAHNTYLEDTPAAGAAAPVAARPSPEGPAADLGQCVTADTLLPVVNKVEGGRWKENTSSFHLPPSS